MARLINQLPSMLAVCVLRRRRSICDIARRRLAITCRNVVRRDLGGARLQVRAFIEQLSSGKLRQAFYSIDERSLFDAATEFM